MSPEYRYTSSPEIDACTQNMLIMLGKPAAQETGQNALHQFFQTALEFLVDPRVVPLLFAFQTQPTLTYHPSKAQQNDKDLQIGVPEHSYADVASFRIAVDNKNNARVGIALEVPQSELGLFLRRRAHPTDLGKFFVPKYDEVKTLKYHQFQEIIPDRWEPYSNGRNHYSFHELTIDDFRRHQQIIPLFTRAVLAWADNAMEMAQNLQ